MNDFNPTHEFRGLKLARVENPLSREYPVIFGMYPYLDEQGFTYYVDAAQLTKIRPKPKPGEVWTFNATPTLKDKSPLRFVDAQGDLVNIWGASQWDPDLDDVEELYRNYTKVLNADGSPA